MGIFASSGGGVRGKEKYDEYEETGLEVVVYEHEEDVSGVIVNFLRSLREMEPEMVDCREWVGEYEYGVGVLVPGVGVRGGASPMSAAMMCALRSG